MIPGLLTYFERVGPARAARMSGVSLTTIQGLLSGKQFLGPINEQRLLRAMGNYRVGILRAAGASKATAEVGRNMAFGSVDKYAAKMESIVNTLVRDNHYPGAAWTEEELRESILKNLNKSEKGVKEMYDRYVG